MDPVTRSSSQLSKNVDDCVRSEHDDQSKTDYTHGRADGSSPVSRPYTSVSVSDLEYSALQRTLVDTGRMHRRC